MEWNLLETKAVSVEFYFKNLHVQLFIYTGTQKVQVLAEQPLTTVGFWPAVRVTGSGV